MTPMTRIVAISGHRKPAITATMIDGSQPSPTPIKYPYFTMQNIHELMNVRIAVIQPPIM
jgi:hypothetical protein